MNISLEAQPGNKLWLVVWKLLRLRLMITLSGFRHARLRRKIGMIALGMLFLAFLGFVFFISWSILRFLQSPNLAEFTGDLTTLVDGMPVLILGGAFIGILLTSFGVLLQALYLAGDMDFLLSKPLPIRAVFITKLLQAILPNFGLICVFALPVLFGLGFSKGYNFLYYPLIIIVLIALALAAAGLSSLLVMLVVRIFPARRVAEVLGFFGAIASFLCSQTGQFANMSEISGDQASQILTLVNRLNTPWSPLAWAGRGVLSIGEGNWLNGLFFLSVTIGLSLLAFVVALTTAERLYYTGWANMQGKSRKKKSSRSTRRKTSLPLLANISSAIPSAVRALLIKDWMVMRRDLRNMSQLVTPLIVGIIYAFMFLRGGPPSPPEPGNMPSWAVDIVSNISLYINVFISLFVGWMLLARLAGMGFSQEGKSYWILKSAPVSVATLIVGKFMVAYTPALLLGWAFLLVITLIQGAGFATLPFTLTVVALCVAGNAGLNLTFGITGAKMDWEDPRQMQKGSSGCLSTIATVIYLPISLLLFFTPELLFRAFQLPALLGQVIGLTVGGVFSLLCGLLPLWLVRNRVRNLAEA